MVDRKALIALASLTLLAAAPLFVPRSFVYLLGLTFIFVVYVISWDVIAGYAGQINLGHTVFIGIGAYTTALLQNPERLGIHIPALPIWVTIFMGGISALLFGLFIGVICLRLKGYYLALVTAILPLIFIQILNIFPETFGGYEGFSVGFDKAISQSVVISYYVALAFMISCILAIHLVLRRIGVKLKALREDEELAEAVGIDVVRYKLVAFCISAFFAGLAGAVMVHYRLTVGPDLFDIPLMLTIILAAVIGGLGTLYGPVIGAFIVYLAKNYIFAQIVQALSLSISDEMFLYALLIFIILKCPRGIFESVRSRVIG